MSYNNNDSDNNLDQKVHRRIDLVEITKYEQITYRQYIWWTQQMTSNGSPGKTV